MTAWQKEQLGVKCIYCWREAFCTTVTWNREVADCDLRCALWSSQSCRRGCQLCSPQNWHTTFVTAWVRHGESTATAACCYSCLLCTSREKSWPFPLTWKLGFLLVQWTLPEKMLRNCIFPIFFLLGGKKTTLVVEFWHLILLLSESSHDCSL